MEFKDEPKLVEIRKHLLRAAVNVIVMLLLDVKLT